MMNFIRNENLGKLILRLTVGFLMLFHGIAKITNPGTLDFIGSKLVATGLPSIISYGVYLGEIIAPLMIILGLFCRFGGVLLVGNMLFAIFLVHTGELFSVTPHGGWAIELQGFYLFCSLALVFLGSGRFALKPD